MHRSPQSAIPSLHRMPTFKMSIRMSPFVEILVRTHVESQGWAPYKTRKLINFDGHP
jgi:hypothetical protein